MDQQLKTYSERLQYVARLKKIFQKDLVLALNKDRGTISRWWTGKIIPGPSNNSEIAAVIGCSEEWLASGKGSPWPTNKIPPNVDIKHLDSKLAKIVQVPVLGKVPAGIPEVRDQLVDEYISVPNAPRGAFALKVSGDSMEPNIKHGDYVLFVIDREAKHGDIVVVNDEFGDSMLKRLKIKDNTYYLTSDNTAYPTFTPNGDYRIMGVVIGGVRLLNIT